VSFQFERAYNYITSFAVESQCTFETLVFMVENDYILMQTTHTDKCAPGIPQRVPRTAKEMTNRLFPWPTLCNPMRGSTSTTWHSMAALSRLVYTFICLE